MRRTHPAGMVTGAARLVVFAAAFAFSGCAMHREPIIRPPGIQVVRSIVLHGHTVRVHIADTRQATGGLRPLIVYATGDRGWAGKDLDFYRHLVSWDYPVAGFDAHDYVKHLGPAATTTPAGLAADYDAIIAAARDALGMRDTDPVVLVGVSRGADLSVVAAGTRLLRPHLSGVVAVALTREEEYVKWFGRRLRRAQANAATRAARGEGDGTTRQMVQLYEYLPLLRELPITVIQSTHDNYLPAAQARGLFGPDTPSRHFVAVEARNHSFAGARDRLYEALHTALDRLSASLGGGRRPAAPPTRSLAGPLAPHRSRGSLAARSQRRCATEKAPATDSVNPINAHCASTL